LRVEDAVNSAKAAVEEGVIAGGGSVLVQAAAALERLAADMDDDEIVGVNVVRKALSSPLFWIAANAGEDGSVVVSKVSEMAPATASTPPPASTVTCCRPASSTRSRSPPRPSSMPARWPAWC
ncbi:hypothetical protein KB219_35515, partial [Pseudomonas aeruginosa]|nr:hypothetical protein [Pseudomonas aeruginosa]